MSEYNWNYLNSQNANPMFQEIAAEVKRHGFTKVLDVACGYSRVNEFLDNVEVDGFDHDQECIAYCNEHFDGDYRSIDGLAFENSYPTEKYDCLIVSGFLYYFKDGMMDYVNRLVRHFEPKVIIVSEPRPSIAYKSPNFIELFDTFAWRAKQVDMDIRMGNRVIYTFYTDKMRPERKIKAGFNEDSIFEHQKQGDFNLDRLRKGVYITNTENIDHDRDGMVTPSSPDVIRYISVAAGFKGMYKACLDYVDGKEFSFIYTDIVPLALDYRMYQDKMIADGIYDFNSILQEYQSTVNKEMMPHFGSRTEDVNYTVDLQLHELNISKEDWKKFLSAYGKMDKTYLRLDAVNNVVLFNRNIQSEQNTWMWYSNIFDWHQFRFKEAAHATWITYLETRNPNINIQGKTPPFTSS